jgi:hypothetical protein
MGGAGHGLTHVGMAWAGTAKWKAQSAPPDAGALLLAPADEAAAAAAPRPPPPRPALATRGGEHAEAVQAVRELPTRDPYSGPGQGSIRVIGEGRVAPAGEEGGDGEAPEGKRQECCVALAGEERS